MLVDEVISKAFRMVNNSKSDEQLRNSQKFIAFLKRSHPKANISELEAAVKEKDQKLHKK